MSDNRPQWPALSSAGDEQLRERLTALHQSAVSKSQNDGLTQKEVLIRWPRLTAHLICQSLGYFSPRAAANAILDVLHDRPCWCEWYAHQMSCRQRYDGDADADILAVGRDTLNAAISGRHRHRGMMSEYASGLAAVASELCGRGPQLASWF